MRADLSGANLRAATLVSCNLEGAILQGADLRDAQLEGANLKGVELREARLSGATWADGDVCGSDSVGRCRPVSRRGGPN